MSTDGGLAFDSHRLGHRADFQFEVHSLCITHRQLDVGIDQDLEALGFSLHRVETGLEVGDGVKALAIRRARGGYPGGLICRGYRRMWE